MAHMTDGAITVLKEEFLFPEGPRWHEGRLWFSDQHLKCVFTLDENGTLERVFDVPGAPSGLGWDSRGRLLVVSMEDRKLLRLEAGELRELADLSAHADFHCNDMVVDRQGRAYVGNFGFDLWNGGSVSATRLAMVDEAGAVRVVAEDLLFPNGMVITPDGKTLILSETYAGRLIAFDIEADGSLSGKRVWAELNEPTDGIALDAEGCVWVAVPLCPGRFLRVAQGGEIRQRIDLEEHGAYACTLGGQDGRTLYLLEAREGQPKRMLPGNGRVRSVRVDVPHAGLP
ncbi:MAG TPA: SMP-30/gluconolactonase/LRE family protein [Polyangiaceae bacterium]|nr:SMP-30/gluconolactonase/LRE family protein [Polyangiaceae bacterium]